MVLALGMSIRVPSVDFSRDYKISLHIRRQCCCPKVCSKRHVVFFRTKTNGYMHPSLGWFFYLLSRQVPIKRPTCSGWWKTAWQPVKPLSERGCRLISLFLRRKTRRWNSCNSNQNRRKKNNFLKSRWQPGHTFTLTDACCFNHRRAVHLFVFCSSTTQITN